MLRESASIIGNGNFTDEEDTTDEVMSSMLLQSVSNPRLHEELAASDCLFSDRELFRPRKTTRELQKIYNERVERLRRWREKEIAEHYETNDYFWYKDGKSMARMQSRMNSKPGLGTPYRAIDAETNPFASWDGAFITAPIIPEVMGTEGRLTRAKKEKIRENPLAATVREMPVLADDLEKQPAKEMKESKSVGEQLPLLEKHFSLNQSPTGHEIAAIAKEVVMTARETAEWFDRRRKKETRMQQAQGQRRDEALSAAEEGGGNGTRGTEDMMNDATSGGHEKDGKEVVGCGKRTQKEGSARSKRRRKHFAQSLEELRSDQGRIEAELWERMMELKKAEQREQQLAERANGKSGSLPSRSGDPPNINKTDVSSPWEEASMECKTELSRGDVAGAPG